MYSAADRFGLPHRSNLNPYEKLTETVHQWLEHQISREEYLETLRQIGALVSQSQKMLSTIVLPEQYDAGPVLGTFAQQGLESFAQSLENLTRLVEQPDPSWARQNLQQAQAAYQSLEELLLEIQTEKGGF